MNPALLLPMMIVMVLSAFYHVFHVGCNSTVVALLENLKIALSFDGSAMDSHKQRVVKAVPVDIRTVRKKFDVDAVTVTYAVCPACHRLFAPRMEDGIAHYPLTCDKKIGATTKYCNRSLAIPAVSNDGQSIRIPEKPFVVQSLDAFKARLLNEPFFLTMAKCNLATRRDGIMTDIFDGDYRKGIKDNNGAPFTR